MENEKKGLAIASLILGIFSLICCTCYGIGLLCALIGLILSVVCIAKGKGKGKTIGIVACVLCSLGLVVQVYITTFVFMNIRWDNMTQENIEKFMQVDPSDREEFLRELQKFFKFDLTGY